MIRENFGFREGQKLVLKFEELLNNNNINIGLGSDLETKFISVFDILFKFEKYHKLAPNEDHRILFRDFSALYDLALKITSVSGHKEFHQLVPHLNKLNECNVAQNAASRITDQEANKIIELYLAAICMRFCDRIELDHPNNAKGNNPDVIAKIQGNYWGFGCKTLHSTNTQTIYENIVKAVDQIEKSKSTTGIPVLNLKNVIRHEDIWPSQQSFGDVAQPLSTLMSTAQKIQCSLLNDLGIDALKEIFVDKKSLPGILFVAQSCTSVQPNPLVSPMATRLNVMQLFKVDEATFTQDDDYVFEALNHYMQLAN